MDRFHQKVVSYEIKKRTFEGKTDPSKNDSALTSKYMTSYKYWVKVQYETYSAERAFPTKQKCIDFVETEKSLEGNKF